jgi:hypothetical protein
MGAGRGNVVAVCGGGGGVVVVVVGGMVVVGDGMVVGGPVFAGVVDRGGALDDAEGLVVEQAQVNKAIAATATPVNCRRIRLSAMPEKATPGCLGVYQRLSPAVCGLA